MATIKRDGKWYIKGRIQKEDGTYYQYTKLARGCKYVDEAREYETEFVKRWQAIQVAKYNKTFAELAEECLAQAVNVKAVTIRTDQDIVDKCNKVFGKKKINLFNKEYLQKFIKGLEEKYSKSVGSEAHPPILKSIAALKNTANSFFIFFSLHTVILLHYITKKRITKYLLAYNILS